MDEQKTEQTSTTTATTTPAETVSQKTPETTTATKPDALTEEKIQQMIAEATQRAIEEGKTLGKREMQAIKDREVAEANRKARLAESRARAYEESLNDIPEENRTVIENRTLKGRVSAYEAERQEEEIRRQQEEYASRLQTSLNSHLDSLGIKSDDKRIDWAKDAPDYLTGRSRFDASVARILKENQKTFEDKQSNTLKEMEAKLRRDLGLDSVDTTTSVATSDGIPTDPGKLRAYVANLSQSEYEKLKPKIDEIRRKL